MAPKSFKKATVLVIVSGCKSIVPVTFLPGASIDAINCAPIASVTEVKMIGISPVAVAAACADGVEFAKIKSTFALTRLFAIVVFKLLSPCAICGSYSTFKPESSIAF